MNFKDIFLIAIKELKTNKLRSILTMLGIVIGISSIMIIMAIGGGARKLIVDQVEIFGSDLVAINPGKEPNGISGFAQAYLKKSLKISDYKALKNKENIPDAKLVVPVVSGNVSASYENDFIYSSLIGSNEKVFDLYKMNIINGNKFSKSDVLSSNKVVVLGKDAVNDLFGLQDPIGKKIKIKGTLFRVVGVTSSQSAAFLGFDRMIIMPYTSAMNYVLGIKYFQEIDIKVSSISKINSVVKDINNLLRNRHNISDSSKDDFFVTTPEEGMKSINSIFDAITAFLAFVAAISLVIGGIGMMNIMFISVTQRTREIGLRKAIGATDKNIMFQFLIESSILTSFGGIIGIIFGIILTWIISIIVSSLLNMQFPFYISIPAILLGVSVSILVGAIFGVYPAIKASKKSPIKSLRYE